MHDFKKWPELTNSQMDIYYFQSPHRQITQNIHVKVIKVKDGDTITAQWYGRDFDFPIRFINIAAPELKEDGGRESQGWLENILLDKEVDVIINPYNRVGKWGRLLGYIIFQGQDMGEQSVNLGQSVMWAQRNEGKIPNGV